MISSLRFFGVRDLDQVRDTGEHAADLGAVGQDVGLADPAEAERPQRAAGLRLGVGAGLTWVTVRSPRSMVARRPTSVGSRRVAAASGARCRR